MLLYVLKYDIHPDKTDAYRAWAAGIVPQLLAVPGIVEFRGYRPYTGSAQVVVTIEFADLAAFETWWNHDEIQRFTSERRTYILNEVTELWGPSPVVPQPLRPNG